MKKMFAMTLTFVLVLSLFAGCVFGNNAASSNLTVALVVAGTFGDRSFYDSSKAGCDKLTAEGIQVNPIDNILYITYAQNEGSFLAGYIAAKLSKSGMIGAVGGKDNDTINDSSSR